MKRSRKSRGEWVLRAAAELVKDENLEIEFSGLLERTGEDMSSEIPNWLYPGLFAVASINLETARLIEKRARRIYPRFFTAHRPLLYPEAGQRQCLALSLQKVLDYIYRILVVSRDNAGRWKLAPNVSFHYAKVASILGLSPIMVYNIFCDYLGSEQLTPKQVNLVKKLGDTTWEQLEVIRSATALTRLLEGPNRPRMLLVRLHHPVGGEPEVASRYQRTCGECTFFSPDSKLCTLWFHVAEVNERLVKEDRAWRRQTSPNLHSCNHFIPKARYVITHTQLQALTSLDKEKEGLERIACVRLGCTGLLDKHLRVGLVVRCKRCGTIYRKNPLGRTHTQIAFLDLLQEKVRSITGKLSKDLKSAIATKPQEKIALFLTPSDAIAAVTSNQLVVEYRGGRLLEEYPLKEIGYLSLPAGQLERFSRTTLSQEKIRVAFRPSQSHIEPKERVSQDLERVTEKERAILFRRHCVANYLGLLHGTLALQNYLGTGLVNQLLWLQLDRIYVISHKTSSTLKQVQNLIRSCEAQMAGLFHKYLRDKLAPSGATHPAIGRARGRWVSYRGDSHGLARAQTPFDTALNLASRLLRNRLRE